MLCFDRDLTVSTNPPHDSLAVPLSWIKYLAHERTDCDVVASGNQHLKKEGAIPGMEEVKRCWELLNVDGALPYLSESDKSGELGESGEYETFKPARRYGLMLVKDVYDTAFPNSDITFIVVDDVDLSDLEGFEYYFPESFVYAVVSEKIFGFSESVPVSDVPVNADNCPESYEMTVQSLEAVVNFDLDTEF